MKSDVTNDVQFATIYCRIHDLKFMVLSHQKLCYICKCIRISIMYPKHKSQVTKADFGNCLPDPEVIKLISCSTQLSMEFIMLINVKKPTIVGILTFISSISTPSESFKSKISFFFSI